MWLLSHIHLFCGLMYYVSPVHGDSPGKVAGVGCHFLPQGIFPTQGSNPCLLHCRWTLYLSHQEVQPKSYRTSCCFLCGFPYEVCFLLSLVSETYCGSASVCFEEGSVLLHLWKHHHLLSISEQRLTGHCQNVSAGWT